MDEKILVGRRLQRIRYEAGFTTAEAGAAALGISVWTLRAWEAGRSKRTIDDCQLIADKWGYDPAWVTVFLLGDEELAEIIRHIPFN